MGIETKHKAAGQLELAKRSEDGQLFSGTHSTFQRQPRSGRLAVAIAGLAIALLVGVFFFNYGSNMYENWRERRLLHRATILLQEGQLSEAAQMARELARRHPDSLTALSILADTAERQNLEEAVEWRERIARLLPKDPESQLNLASAALRFGKLDVAREALNRVSPGDRDSAAFHVVAGWLARAEGNFVEQEEQFAAAVTKEPKNDLYQFNLAALQIRSKETEKSKNARDTLERLSTIAPYRTGALRALLNDAVDRNDRTAADSFAQQLQMSPEVTFGDLLLCLKFYRKLDEKRFRQLLDKVKPFAARDVSDLASLIEWMNQNGLAGEVAKWVDKLPAALLKSPPASVAVADAYSTVKNWSRLKRWTRAGDWGDAEYLRFAYEAIAERHLRSSNTPAFESLWQSAAELSGDDSERELTLARLATKWQLARQAEKVWVRVEENPTMRREALDNLRELYRARDETSELYAVLERLHESSPNETAITADLGRLGLNLGVNTERSHQFAKEAYDRSPNDVNCAVTYAYSLHRLGRTAEALAIIQDLPVEQLHDVHAAVYVALVLAGGNELEGAKDYITAGENGKLYPDEKKLLEEAKVKLIAASATPSPPPGATPSP
jgi:predicted Zn-dependent protease